MWRVANGLDNADLESKKRHQNCSNNEMAESNSKNCQEILERLEEGI